MKSSQPNYTSPSSKLKGFTSLCYVHQQLEQPKDGVHTLRSAKISIGRRNMQIAIRKSN